MLKQWLPVIATSVILAAPAIAQTDTQTNTPLSQTFPALQGISLTATQTTQLQTLRDQMLPQLVSLLTPSQQAQFQTGLQAGKGVRASALATNLSMPQRLQVMQLLQGMQGQLSQILTPEQLQQVKQNLRSQQQGR